MNRVLRAIFIALTLLSLSAGIMLHAQPSPRRIIDVHLHAHRADRFGKAGLPNPVTGKPSAATTDRALIDEALRQMQAHGIVLGVASSELDSVERWRLAGKGRIIGGAQIDVGIPAPDLARLRRDIVAKRVGQVGEIGAQYLGLAPTDPSLAPYFALAEELDVPVAIHTGISDPETPYHCCPAFRVALGRPMLLEELLIRHPKLRVNLMHAGYPYLDETIALMAVYPQVYADTGAISWLIPREEFHRYMQALMRAGFGKRLMFASDQMIWPEAIGMAVEAVDTIPGLTGAQKHDIFYENAVRFLRIDTHSLNLPAGSGALMK